MEAGHWGQAGPALSQVGWVGGCVVCWLDRLLGGWLDGWLGGWVFVFWTVWARLVQNYLRYINWNRGLTKECTQLGILFPIA